MRTVTLIVVYAIICLSHNLHAQNLERWEFGIFAEHGRDWYHRNYSNTEMLPFGYIPDFPSRFSRGAGLFAERHFNPNFSALAQLTYAQKNMPVEIYGEHSGTHSYYYLQEIHHRGLIEAGLRWYINPKFSFQLFVDGKVGINRLISAVQNEMTLGKIVTRDAFGYNRMAPLFSCSTGINWKRFSVSAEYRQDLTAVRHEYRNSSIKSQSLVGKISLNIFRIKRQ